MPGLGAGLGVGWQQHSRRCCYCSNTKIKRLRYGDWTASWSTGSIHQASTSCGGVQNVVGRNSTQELNWSMSAPSVDTCTCREQDGCMGLAARSNKLHDASPTSCVFRRGPCAWRCQALLDQCSMLLHVIWIRHVAVSERARLRYMCVCQVAARITGTPARVLPAVS